jgi:hypothetical protein
MTQYFKIIKTGGKTKEIKHLTVQNSTTNLPSICPCIFMKLSKHRPQAKPNAEP